MTITVKPVWDMSIAEFQVEYDKDFESFILEHNLESDLTCKTAQILAAYIYSQTPELAAAELMGIKQQRFLIITLMGAVYLGMLCERNGWSLPEE